MSPFEASTAASLVPSAEEAMVPSKTTRICAGGVVGPRDTGVGARPDVASLFATAARLVPSRRK